jgi:hypothetical protein
MKHLIKINSSDFKINFDSTKFFGNLFIILSLLPWVSFGLNNLDSQPWAFIFAIIFFLAIKRIIFPKYSIKIIILVVLGLIFATSITSSIDSSLIRALINYLSLPLLYVAFYNYFIRYGVPIKLFIVLNFVWIFFGFIELFFPEIMSLLSKMRTSPSRGVTSLAPEATFFGIYLFFSSLLFFELKNLINTNKIFILLVINFLAVLFLAKSSTVVLFYVISLFSFLMFKFFYTLRDLKILKKNIKNYIIWPIIFLTILILFKDSLSGTRLYSLSALLLEKSIMEIVIMDASINSRVESFYFSQVGVYKNYFLPGGFDSFIEMRRQIFDTSETKYFLNRYESNKIMSWIGSIFYELGIFGIMITAFLFKAIHYKSRGSIFYIITLFVILLSAVPVAFPLVPMVIALILYNNSYDHHKIYK